MHIFRGNLYKTTERSDLKSNKNNQPKMKISLIISLKSVFGFGYTSTKAVSNLLWIILFHQNRHNSGTIRLFFGFRSKNKFLIARKLRFCVTPFVEIMMQTIEHFKKLTKTMLLMQRSMWLGKMECIKTKKCVEYAQVSGKMISCGRTVIKV